MQVKQFWRQKGLKTKGINGRMRDQRDHDVGRIFTGARQIKQILVKILAN
jgi:hypothetical protein